MNFIVFFNIFAYNLISFHFFKTNKKQLDFRILQYIRNHKNIFLSKLFNSENPYQTEQIPNSVFVLSVFSLLKWHKDSTRTERTRSHSSA